MGTAAGATEEGFPDAFGQQASERHRVTERRPPLRPPVRPDAASPAPLFCYLDSHDRDYPGELTTDEGRSLLDDLAGFGIPTVIFSGGEPLIRADVFELAAYAHDLGLRCVLSSNGTLITRDVAARIKEAGFSYVGISIDGIGPQHDKVRGKVGAFDDTLSGLRRCRDLGVRVGLRFTVHRKNVDALPAIFDLMEEERIPRLCVYHLAYAGRGDRIRKYDLDPAETRKAVKFIFDRTRDLGRRGKDTEVLTVDNHTDNVYLYMTMQDLEPERAEEVHQMLAWNGGNQSGIAIANIGPRGTSTPTSFRGTTPSATSASDRSAPSGPTPTSQGWPS